MINFGKLRLRIKQRIKRFKLKQTVVNSIVVVLIAAMAIYMVVQLSRNFVNSVSTLRAQQITDTDSLTLKGYVFRDEKIYSVGDGKVAEFLIDNGEKVNVGKHVANIYSLSSSSKRDDVQAQLNSLTDRIRLLENGVSNAKKLSEASAIFDDIDDSYYAFLLAVQNNNYSLADTKEQQFLDAMNTYMVATGRTQEAQSTINALKAEKDALVSSHLSGGCAPLTVEKDQGCYFYSEYDGYEQLFDYSRVMEMTAAEFSALTSAQKQKYGGGAIGKQVFSPTWYICFEVSDELCDMFVSNSENQTPMVDYTASFLSNNGANLTLTFEKAVYADAQGNSGFAVFSCKQMPKGFDFARAQNVQIQLSSTTGYRVPTQAVYGEGQERFVYVLNGNMVEKRRITVIGNGNGYFIVNTFEADYNEGGENTLPYLAINELIITSGRNLYDGKLLK
ncbi:MAG: hypothetical protein E7667_04910 [Ruminococcaceae bacterium]|nr:hypothetical protein [Oscillospiraceae bacterium]